MATKLEKERMKEVGYCASNQAPRCSNCKHVNEDIYKEKCLLRKIPISSAGWCPNWNPTENWRTQNPIAFEAILEN